MAIVRARVAQTVHIVRNVKSPLPEPVTRAFARLAQATGFSLLADHAALPYAESGKPAK